MKNIMVTLDELGITRKESKSVLDYPFSSEYGIPAFVLITGFSEYRRERVLGKNGRININTEKIKDYIEHPARIDEFYYNQKLCRDLSDKGYLVFCCKQSEYDLYILEQPNKQKTLERFVNPPGKEILEREEFSVSKPKENNVKGYEIVVVDAMPDFRYNCVKQLTDKGAIWTEKNESFLVFSMGNEVAKSLVSRNNQEYLFDNNIEGVITANFGPDKQNPMGFLAKGKCFEESLEMQKNAPGRICSLEANQSILHMAMNHSYPNHIFWKTNFLTEREHEKIIEDCRKKLKIK